MRNTIWALAGLALPLQVLAADVAPLTRPIPGVTDIGAGTRSPDAAEKP